MIKVLEAGQLQLAVMASGRGSNFDAICAAIERGDLNACIRVVVSDKEQAAVLQKAKERDIPAIYINPRVYPDRTAYESEIVEILKENLVDVVALAGYMRLVGPVLLGAFPHRLLNIHPALLPSFTGLHAQEQAVVYGVKYSGCTVHIVDEGTDTGPIILQRVVPVLQEDDVDTLAARILVEEHDLYWRCLQYLAEGRLWLDGRKVYIR